MRVVFTQYCFHTDYPSKSIKATESTAQNAKLIAVARRDRLRGMTLTQCPDYGAGYSDDPDCYHYRGENDTCCSVQYIITTMSLITELTRPFQRRA